MEEEKNEKETENGGKTKLDIALIVCLSISIACNVVQIVLRIIEMAR